VLQQIKYALKPQMLYSAVAVWVDRHPQVLRKEKEVTLTRQIERFLFLFDENNLQ
jgi:hypothetical protein